MLCLGHSVTKNPKPILSHPALCTEVLHPPQGTGGAGSAQPQAQLRGSAQLVSPFLLLPRC